MRPPLPRPALPRLSCAPPLAGRARVHAAAAAQMQMPARSTHTQKLGHEACGQRAWERATASLSECGGAASALAAPEPPRFGVAGWTLMSASRSFRRSSGSQRCLQCPRRPAPPHAHAAATIPPSGHVRAGRAVDQFCIRNWSDSEISVLVSGSLMASAPSRIPVRVLAGGVLEFLHHVAGVPVVRPSPCAPTRAPLLPNHVCSGF